MSERSIAIKDFLRRPRPLALRCGVQHYVWGDPDYIPELIGTANRDHRPYAELWIGAHPDLPSSARIGADDVSLPVLFDSAAETILGLDDAARFDRQLPFLLKILSAAQPLSIQVHPNKRQAREGFAREERLGISTADPGRSYHDDHHKPELIAALTDFHALKGFRPLSEIDAMLRSTPELCALAGRYRPTDESLIALYKRLMRMDQAGVDALLTPLLLRLRDEDQRLPFVKQQPEYWALKADAVFSRSGHRDRGVLSIFLLNLVHLAPGEALYLSDGELHAYLEGCGVEVMANSNNVLRGGLTRKHTDVAELLRILAFRSGDADVIRPSLALGEPGAVLYQTPADEFVLLRLRVAAGYAQERDQVHGVDLGIVTEGAAVVSATNGDDLYLRRGDAFLVPHGMAYKIESDAEAMIFMASVPAGSEQRAS